MSDAQTMGGEGHTIDDWTQVAAKTTETKPRRWGLHLVLALTMFASSLTLVVTGDQIAPGADAAFTPRFTANAQGKIVFAGNTLLTCRASADCTAAQTGAGEAWANNNFSMVNVDVDSIGSTNNSSSAELTVPPGATVLFAGLYWGAVSNAANRDEVELDLPSTPGYAYSTVTASTLFATGSTYQGFADITDEVRAGGSGEYTVGDVAARTGSDRHAGWSIVVVLEDEDEPFRNLAVFDGWNQIRSGEVQDIEISGFLTPATGPVNAEIGMIAYEGDDAYTGDFVQLDGTTLSDAANPADNFFNSTITTGGVPNPGRNPSYADQLGYDANIVQTSGVVAPSATSATVTLASRGDWFYPGVITSAIDIFVPNLGFDLTKNVTDNNGGLTHPGDTLSYRISFTNSGTDAAIEVELTDAIPAGTTYVPGSLVVVSGHNPGSRTDAVDGDTAHFDGSDLVFHLGDGATSSAGGRIDPFSSTDTPYEIGFQVTVDDGTEHTTITNTAEISYTGFTIDEPQNRSASVDRTIEPLSDVRLLSKTDDVDPVTAGAATPVIYQLEVGNFGPSPARDATVIDTLPAGVSYVDGSSDSRCEEEPLGSGTIVCDLGTLAAAAPALTETMDIAVTVDADVAVGVLGNSAVVSTSTPDASTADDTATEKTSVIRRADLSLTKSAAPSPSSAGNAIAGGEINYLLTVSNSGASTATNATLIDSLPTGTSFVSATASGIGTCTQPGAVECSWPSIAPGDSETVTVVLAIDADQGVGTLTNHAEVTADETDPNNADNSTSASVEVIREIDLTVTKSHLGPGVAGDTLFHVVSVSNGGTSSATDTTVVDNLPTGVTFNPALSSAGCILASAPSQVSCELGTIQPGATLNVTIAVTLAPDIPDGVEIVNTAQAMADEGLSTYVEDRVPVEREVDLSLVKSADADPVIAGDSLRYTLTVKNDGPSNTTGATITDTLPAGVTLETAGTDARCSGPGPLITCSGIDLAAGASDEIEILVTVAPDLTAGAVLTNTATITAPPTDQDTQPGNNTSWIETPVKRTSALEVIKVDAADPVLAGDEVSWTITVINHGPSADTNVTLTDALPAGVDLRSVTGPCSETSPGANVVVCSFGSMPAAPAAGSEQSITITADVAADLTAGTMLDNTATVDGDTSPSVSGTEQTTVARESDLVLTKTPPTTAVAGSPMSYELTLVNNGPSDAESVLLTEILPPSLVADSWTATTGFATCSGEPLQCTPGSAAADGILAAGSSVTIQIETTTDPSSAEGSTLTNRATATGASTDPDPANNLVSTNTATSRSADLAITKTIRGEPTPAGETLIYDLTVDNLGPSQATDVTVTDRVPAGLTFLTAGSSAGCSYSSPDVTCSLGTIDPDDPAARLVLAFTVDPAQSDGTIVNRASVTTTEADPVSDNDTDDAETTIRREADLSLIKTSSDTPATPGGVYVYNLSITNAGPSNAQNTTVVDTLPSGTTFVASLSDPRCTVDADNVVSCDLATMPPQPAAGSQSSVTIVVEADSDLSGTLTNSATVTSDATDPEPADNSDVDSSPLLPEADLLLSKEALASAVVGEQLTYRLTVTNEGPSDATGVVVTDELPPELTFVPAGSSPECTVAGSVSGTGSTVTCTLADPLPNGAAPVAFNVLTTIAADVADNERLSNTAVVVAETLDPDESDNQTQLTVTATRSSDLSVTKSVSPSPALAGQTVDYRLTIRNDGPSDASGIALTDALPDGVTPLDSTPDPGLACQLDQRDLTCSGPTLVAGESLTVLVRAKVESSVPDNATVINTASISAVEPDANSTNNGAAANVAVARESDLTITKTSTVQPVATAGSSHLFQIEIANTGLSDASGVVVTDLLPAGVTFDPDLSSSQCAEGPPGEITCTIGSLPAGADLDLVVGTRLASSLSDGTAIINEASITGNETESNLENNTDDVRVEVGRVADLSIVKQGPTEPVDAGESLSYELVVTNIGPSDATGVDVTDVLPPGLVAIAGSPTDSRCTVIDQALSCVEAGPLAPSETTTFIVAATTSASLGEGVVLDNDADVEGNESDPNETNNRSRVTTEFTRSSNLSVVKVDTSDPVVAGEPLNYTIMAINDGPSVADNAVITDTLPVGLSYLHTGSDPRCIEQPTAGSGVIECALGTLEVGPTNAKTITIATTIDSTITAGNQLENLVTLEADSATRVEAKEETTVESEADLVVTKTLTTETPIAGEPVSWTVAVENQGPSDAVDVVLTDILPTGIENVRTDTDPLTCVIDGAVAMCNRATLAVGDRFEVTITGDIASWVTTGTNLTNHASATTASVDPDVENNRSSADAVITRSVELAIDKTAAATRVAAGTTASWIVVANNAGPSYASDVVIIDTLPLGLTFDAEASSTDCAESESDSATIICRTAVVPDGQSVSFTVAATVPSSVSEGAELVNVAVVEADEPNTNPLTQASAAIGVAAVADLSVTKAPQGVLIAGRPARYDLVVSSSGSSTATEATVVDTLPPELTFDPGTSDPRCQPRDSTVTCIVGEIAAGTSETVTVGVLVASTAEDVIANTVTVEGSMSDPDPTNNTFTHLADVERAADFGITKAGAQRNDQIGVVDWSIAVTNQGPSAAAAMINDNLVPTLAYRSSHSSDEISCTHDEGLVTCITPILEVGETARLVISTDVKRSGTVFNEAVVVAVRGNHSSIGCCQPRVAGVSIEASAESPGSLAFTGSSTGRLLMTATVLVSCGGLLIGLARRRRASPTIRFPSRM